MRRSFSLSWKVAFLPVRAASPDMATYRRYAPVSGRRRRSPSAPAFAPCIQRCPGGASRSRTSRPPAVRQPQHQFVPGAGLECQRNLPVSKHLVIDEALATIRVQINFYNRVWRRWWHRRRRCDTAETCHRGQKHHPQSQSGLASGRSSAHHLTDLRTCLRAVRW